jgi:hypothetical protein
MMRKDEERTLKQRLEHFAEEIADVELMIDEFTWKFGLGPDIDYFRSVKTQRLKTLLEETYTK